MASLNYSLQIQKMLIDNEPTKCSFNNCLHLGEPGCVVNGEWERYPYYFQLLDEIRIREEFQLRTFGTKREGDVRYVQTVHGVSLMSICHVCTCSTIKFGIYDVKTSFGAFCNVHCDSKILARGSTIMIIDILFDH